MEAIYWLVAFVVLIGVEAVTMALTTIWFAGGVLIAFFLALFDMSIQIQLASFVIVSFLLLFFTRPLALRYVNRYTVKTNIEGLIGKHGKVIVEINNLEARGTVVLNGQEWTARALSDDTVYQAGAMVEVKAIQGVKLIVSKEKEET